jgi:bacteriorhodopsin
MEASPSTNQGKQITLSLFINLAMTIYAVCTLIKALQTGVVWRIVCSGVGSVFFLAVFIMLILKLVKLRKAN